MPIFIAALLGGLIQAAGTLVGRVLLSLGIGAVTYTGFSVALDAFKAQIFTNFSQTGTVIVGMLYTLRVDQAVNITISAVLIKYTLAGLTSGTITKLIHK